MQPEPVTLTDEDLAALKKCFITPQLAEQSRLLRVDTHRGAELVGRNGSGDYSGIVFPYFWPGEDTPREYRLRRDFPDLEQQSDGSVKEKGKYLSPPGRGSMLYFMHGISASTLENTSRRERRKHDADALTEWAKGGGLVENNRNSGTIGSEASPSRVLRREV